MVSAFEKRGLLACYYSLLTLCMFILVVTTFLSPQAKRIHRSVEQESLPKVIKSFRAIQDNKESTLESFFRKEFNGRDIKIGYLTMEEDEAVDISVWQNIGETSLVHFNAVSEPEFRWKDLFNSGDRRSSRSYCLTVPTSSFGVVANDFDVVVLRPPCGSKSSGKGGGGGIRDVRRLKAHLIAAKLMVRSGWGRSDRAVFAVFVGSSCAPMWEIFRCDDLVMHQEGLRIFRPDLSRLEQKLQLLVGYCDSVLPVVKQDGKMNSCHETSTKLQTNSINGDDQHPREAYATVLHSSERYVCGAIALARSILQTNSSKDLVLLADKTITKKSREALSAVGWKIEHIDRIRCPTAKKGAYNEWNYSKLRLWQLTEYDKLIFIDSDLIVLKNMDSFFASPQLSAARNSDTIFNSGVILVEPSKCMFDLLMEKKDEVVSYNGGDQGFLNEVFKLWHQWPQEVNHLKYFLEGSRRDALPETYTIHYLGYKPWICYRDYDCNWDKEDHRKFASDIAHWRWWELYDSLPENLRGFCDLSPFIETRLRRDRENAARGNFSDGHWKIKVKDPRQHLDH